MTPAVDVVVVTFNSADHIADAVAPFVDRSADSTAPASGPAPGHAPGPRSVGIASLVVIDNASTDDTVAVARSAGAEVVAGAVNAGFAAGANRGAGLGDAELILFLNPDARITLEALAAMAAELQAHPDVAVVGARLLAPTGPQRSVWPYPSSRQAWRDALGWPPRRWRARESPGRQDGFVVGACLLMRREVFASAGGFDTRFWLYGEESDLCERLQDDGWAIWLADAAVHHAKGASGAGVERLVFDHFQRGGEHFVSKREGGRGVVGVRLAELVGSLLRLVPGPPPRRLLHRRRLVATVRRLVTHPTRVALDSPATRAPGVGLVVCSLEAWDEVWRRNQFLVRELLAAEPDRRVLFVEPPFDVAHERRHPTGRRRQRGLRPVDGEGRIIRYEPAKWWPRMAGPFADASLRRQVRRSASQLGFDDPDLWINDPSYAGLVSATGWPATYDITDDWTQAAADPRARRRVERNERTLFDRCGSVVVCSPGLAGSRRPARPDLVTIANAVDVDHFRRPRPRPDDLPAPDSGPVAVYVGTLHTDRLDVDLVERLAREVPGLAVVLVGPDALDQHSRSCLDAAGVVRLGPRPYEDVPGYLQHADVVLVPHVVTPFTESLDPIKAYECLAAGRPTVATPVAGFRDLGAPVVCVPAGQFVEAVRTASDEPAAGPPTDLPSWADRADAFARALARARAPRHAPAGASADPRPVLRVVAVDHCAQLSGAEIALRRLCAALDRQRGADAAPVEVSVHVVLGEHGPLEGELREAGATVEVLALDERVAQVRKDAVTGPAVGARRLVLAGRDVVALARRLRQLEPDLVYTNSMKSHLYGGVAARMAGVPLVWHVRDRIAPDYLPRAAVALMRWAARWLPDAIIANSSCTLETVGRAVTDHRIPAHAFYGIVEASTVAPLAADRLVDGRRLRVVMVGRLAPWKGQDIFVEAFSLAFGRGEAEARLVGSAMFGEEAFETDLRANIERLGLAEEVEITGFRSDVDQLLAEADIVVHASVVPEPFGQVVVEAMAAGRPVIASALGGPGEIVTDGIDGLLSPPGDVAALAARMRRLADDPELRGRLAEAGRRRARDFEPQVLAPQFVERLVEAVDAGRRRGRTAGR